MTQFHSYDPQNVFARILRGELPAKKIFEDPYVLGFYDAFPRAPIHALMIPKKPYIDATDFYSNGSQEEILAFQNAWVVVADLLGLKEKGFKILIHQGRAEGQEIFHFHVHIMAHHSSRLHPVEFCSGEKMER